jgi:hypothetical protein
VHGDAWYEATVPRERQLARWEDSVREGIEAVGRDSPAAARMAESLAFFEFLRQGVPPLLGRWRERRGQATHRR